MKVAEIFRRHGNAYIEARQPVSSQVRVMRAVAACRTAVMGGHLDKCDHCGHERPAYNSCRNRHCPSCQTAARDDWLEGRLERVLPTRHFHVVFTLPQELRPIALRNQVEVYGIMMKAAAETLATLGRDRLGALPGVTTVLHTWTRQLAYHPHVHCVVTGGGLAMEGSRWVATSERYLFPVAAMRRLFRGIVRTKLRKAYGQGQLDLEGSCARFAAPEDFRRLLRSLHRKRWVVYSKPPFAGTDQVFTYLGRYTHRIGISDYRLVALGEREVTFRTRDGGTCTLDCLEFIRRFLLHVLPSGFHKIRHTGLYASSNVNKRLPVARRLLGGSSEDAPREAPEPEEPSASPDGAEQPRNCPHCQTGWMQRHAVPRSPSWRWPEPDDSS